MDQSFSEPPAGPSSNRTPVRCLFLPGLTMDPAGRWCVSDRLACERQVGTLSKHSGRGRLVLKVGGKWLAQVDIAIWRKIDWQGPNAAASRAPAQNSPIHTKTVVCVDTLL